MSVFIKGMKKPRNCGGCPFNESDLKCVLNGGCIDRDDYSCETKCPMIEVLTPHGRLIDADALEKRMLDRELELNDDRALWESSAVTVALDMFGKTIIEAESEGKE